MGESRSDLLIWINSVTQGGYTKVEQCGNGAAYCQILDALYGDIAMSKVKLNANQEYQFVSNFKVLQKAFKDHGVDKPIPVDKLIKCKMQDNLEFIQWLKKFWDANWDGQEYDPVGRAGGQVAAVPASTHRTQAARVSSATNAGRGSTPVTGARNGVPASRSGGGLARAGPSMTAAAREIENLHVQLQELTAHSLTLEKERDFYFAKLRDVELLVQGRLTDVEDQDETEEKETLTAIQELLYSTEEGFEAPTDEMDGLGIEDDLQDQQLLDNNISQAPLSDDLRHQDIDETF